MLHTLHAFLVKISVKCSQRASIHISRMKQYQVFSNTQGKISYFIKGYSLEEQPP